MGKYEEIERGDFDFDGESKDFRKTFGKIWIIFGLLLIIFNTNFLVRNLKVVIGGQSIEAQISKSKVFHVATYEADGKQYIYDLDRLGAITSPNQETITLYYKGDVKNAIAVNWFSYGISYPIYFIMIGFGHYLIHLSKKMKT